MQGRRENEINNLLFSANDLRNGTDVEFTKFLTTYIQRSCDRNGF